MSNTDNTPVVKQAKAKVKGRSPSDVNRAAKFAGKKSKRSGYKGPTKSQHFEPEDVITDADKLRSVSGKTANIIANFEGSHTEKVFKYAKGDKPVSVRFPKEQLTKEDKARRAKQRSRKQARNSKRGD